MNSKRIFYSAFFSVKNDNILLVAVSNSNPNACFIFEFLYKIVKLGKSYFGIFNEESVKNNFSIIYELFDGNFIPFSWVNRDL